MAGEAGHAGRPPARVFGDGVPQQQHRIYRPPLLHVPRQQPARPRAVPRARPQVGQPDPRAGAGGPGACSTAADGPPEHAAASGPARGKCTKSASAANAARRSACAASSRPLGSRARAARARPEKKAGALDLALHLRQERFGGGLVCGGARRGGAFGDAGATQWGSVERRGAVCKQGQVAQRESSGAARPLADFNLIGWLSKGFNISSKASSKAIVESILESESVLASVLESFPESFSLMQLGTPFFGLCCRVIIFLYGTEKGRGRGDRLKRRQTEVGEENRGKRHGVEGICRKSSTMDFAAVGSPKLKRCGLP